MIKAVILVKAPKSFVAQKLRDIKDVRFAFNISGRFDAVALLEVKELSELKGVTAMIQKIPRVQRTETLVQVE